MNRFKNGTLVNGEGLSAVQKLVLRRRLCILYSLLRYDAMSTHLNTNGNRHPYSESGSDLLQQRHYKNYRCTATNQCFMGGHSQLRNRLANCCTAKLCPAIRQILKTSHHLYTHIIILITCSRHGVHFKLLQTHKPIKKLTLTLCYRC